jgi:hypothetical protein
MKNISKYTIIILLITFSAGCKKSLFKRHAVGKVVDITDGTPIPLAEIAIINEQTELLGNTKQTILATGNTDEKGEFEVSYNTESDGDNVVYAKADHYFNDPITDYEKVTRSTRKKLEIKLTPKTTALVSFSITDTNISYVYFRFNIDSKSSESMNAISNQQKYFLVRGNVTNSYLYIIYYKNGNELQKNGSIFCPKYDKPMAVVNLTL